MAALADSVITESIWLGRARLVGSTVLRAYSQLVFSRSPYVGAMLIAATLPVPRAFLGGLAGVLFAIATAFLLGFDRDAVFDGGYAVSALLLGLGVAQWFGLGPAGWALLVIFAPLSVLIGAALRSRFAAAQLPVLSLPFLGAFYLLLGLTGAAAVPYALQAFELPQLLPKILPPPVHLILSSVGALFFMPRADSGLLILAALSLHSRIATLLATLALGICLLLRIPAPFLNDEHLFHSLAYNAVFTAVSLGGVWFVPSLSSFVLAICGVILCFLFTAGSAGPLLRLGLPVLVVPFNLTLLMMLMAFRQRTHDKRPKSVDFAAGTPEQNLAYFRTRRARFQSPHAVRFLLPVRGAWTCTQGEDGPLTHRGIWRHAFDFEVMDEQGRTHGDGKSDFGLLQLSDYHAYRLPVLATAGGSVVKVVADIADNEIGTVNLERNWGNLIIIKHAPGLFSMVAHLAHESVKVVEGQVVKAGDMLGLCGNSGRSPTPHVHFQLQSGPQPGDATLPCRFADAVQLSSEPPQVVAALLPKTDELVRNLDPSLERAAFFELPYGAVWTLRQGDQVEHIHSDLDLYGQLFLRSREHGAVLYYGLDGVFFTAYDFIGASQSALHLLRAALARVPLEENGRLRWSDLLPARMFRGRLFGAVMDLAAPFLPQDSIEIEYHAERHSGVLVVCGESKVRDRSGKPILQTRAELRRGAFVMRLSVKSGGREMTLEQIDAAADREPALLSA